MLPRILTILCLALLSAAPLAADTADAAWQARDLLGATRWAQVLRIERSRGLFRSEPVHALVFELEGRLWFYTGARGTESLSTHRDHLEQDKADLLPLLQQIDSQFTGYRVVRHPPGHLAGGRTGAGLPNGCFIESVAFLQSLVALGRAPDDARLLAYYGINGPGRGGHTVLYYERGGQRFIYDPAGPDAPSHIPAGVESDALAVARVAAPPTVQRRPERAVFLPVRIPASPYADWNDAPAMASALPAPTPLLN